MLRKVFSRENALDIGTVVGSIVVGGIVLFESLLSPVPATRNDVGLGPNWFPIVMSVLLIAFALVIALQLVRKAARRTPASAELIAANDGSGTNMPRVENARSAANPAAEVDADLLNPHEWFRVGRLVALLVIYVLAMPIVGFLISTTLFIMAMYLHLGVRQLLVPILVACGTSFAIYGIFALGLDVQLPIGSIFGR